jgi:hypothetical protein
MHEIMANRGLCGWCGLEKELAAPAMCADCRPLADEHARRRQQLRDTYVVATDSPEKVQMSWDEAVSAVAGHIGSPVECDPAEAIEAATWWYVPHGWIGCLGFIVDKRDGEVTQLGSAPGLDDSLWGYTRRVYFERVDLTFTAVHDTEQTVRFLRFIHRRIPLNPGAENSLPEVGRLRLMLANLPCTLVNMQLWPSMSELRAAEAAGHFEFVATQAGTGSKPVSPEPT